MLHGIADDGEQDQTHECLAQVSLIHIYMISKGQGREKGETAAPLRIKRGQQSLASDRTASILCTSIKGLMLR